MLQEVTREKAFKAAASGKMVVVMSGSINGTGTYDTLDSLLEGSRLLVEVAAVPNPEFEEAVQGMVENNTPPEEKPEPPVPPKKRKAIDTGKLMALRKAGWTMKNIAIEFGVSEATIYNYLKNLEENHGGATDTCTE